MSSLCTASPVSAPQVSGSHQPGSPHSVTGAGDWGTDVSWLRKEVAANGRAVHTIKSLGAQIVWAVLMCHSLPQRVMISASAHEIF